MRGCDKGGCEGEATVSVVMRYETREVRLGDLAAGRDPNLIDLCGRHAEALTPPLGWHVTDDRIAAFAAAPAPSAESPGTTLGPPGV